MSLLGAFLLAAVLPLPAADQEWTRVTSPHFTITSSAGERAARDLAVDFETLGKVLDHFRPPGPQPPTRVIVFTRRGEARPYLDLLLNREQRDMSGLFISQRGVSTILIDAARGRTARRTPNHELVHSILSSADPRPPLWIEEGLAEYYSNARTQGGAIRVGMPIREHLGRLRRGRLMKVTEVFGVARGMPLATDLRFYAQSWALVDWMLRSNRRAFDAVLQDLGRGVSSEEALRTHYGRTAADLDSILSNYGALLSGQFTVVLAAGARANVDVTVEKVRRADVVFELGRLLASLDRAASEAEEHFRAVLQEAPDHSQALAGIGRLHARAGKLAEARGWFDRAIAAGPEDGIAHLMYAEALLGREIGGLAQTATPEPSEVVRFHEARSLATRALELGADETRARGAIGISYIGDPDPSPAIPFLERAHELFPNRSDYAVHLQAIYVRTGNLDRAAALKAKMQRILAPPLRTVMSSIALRPAVARINDLVDSGNLDQAVTELTTIIDAEQDQGMREQLLRERRRLSVAARSNRDVLRYNEAVRLFEDGDLGAARTTLDELIRDTDDPTVCRSAAELRRALDGAAPLPRAQAAKVTP